MKARSCTLISLTLSQQGEVRSEVILAVQVNHINLLWPQTLRTHSHTLTDALRPPGLQILKCPSRKPDMNVSFCIIAALAAPVITCLHGFHALTRRTNELMFSPTHLICQIHTALRGDLTAAEFHALWISRLTSPSHTCKPVPQESRSFISLLY